MLRLTLVEVAFFLAVSPIAYAQSSFTVGTATAAPTAKSGTAYQAVHFTLRKFLFPPKTSLAGPRSETRTSHTAC
jgi:hypothetical protein